MIETLSKISLEQNDDFIDLFLEKVAYSESCQASKMKRFAKKVNN